MKSVAVCGLFVAGLLTFFAFRFGYTLVPLYTRHEPVEIDDSYIYAWKAVAGTHCVNASCPGVDSIVEQLHANPKDPRLGEAKFRASKILLHRYTFLHEQLLLLVRACGGSWREAILLVQLCTLFLSLVAIAYWLYHLWGPALAGWAMLVVAPLMHWEDFHLASPHIPSLGLAAWCWGFLLARGPKSMAAPYVLIVSSICSMMMHPIGRIFSIISWGLFFVQSREALGKREVVTLLSGVAITLAAFLSPTLMENRYALSEHALPGYGSFGWFQLFTENIEKIFAATRLGSGWFKVVVWCFYPLVMVLAVHSLASIRRMACGYFGFVLGAVAFASLLHTFPTVPATLYGRLWTPVACMYAAALGALVLKEVRNLMSREERLLTLQDALRLSVVSLFLWNIVPLAAQAVSETAASVAVRTVRQPYVLSSDVKEVMASLDEESHVLYLDEIPWIQAMIEGGYRLRATYARLISARQQLNSADFNVLIGHNHPLEALANRSRYPLGLYINEVRKISFRWSERPRRPADLGVFLTSPEPTTSSARITVCPTAGTHCDRVQVSIRTGEWIYPLKEYDASYEGAVIHFEMFSEADDIRVHGLRFKSSNSESVLWPWSSEATITVTQQQGAEKKALFSFCAGPYKKFISDCDQFRVILDGNAMVIARKFSVPQSGARSLPETLLSKQSTS